MDEKEKSNKKQKKKVAKAYEQYASEFTPKPKYVQNCLKAFVVGGLICVGALLLEKWFIRNGFDEISASTYVTILLVMTAQLLTGIGVFDTIGKFAGAGVIVPITGFANSVAAPATEFKVEGNVFGTGCKIFTIAGPVILYGIFTSWLLGIIYLIWQKFAV